MSSLLVFKRKYFPHSVIIQDCFTLQRKGRLLATVKTSPWANGLRRLLAERRGLTKEKLAELSPQDEKGKPLYPRMISKIAGGHDHTFQMSFLVRLAEGFTRWDRAKNPQAPSVELWEFFISDEQAAALHDRASKVRAESADDALVRRIAEMVREDRMQREAPAPPAPVIVEPGVKKKTK
jgi:hypothetical protein